MSLYTEKRKIALQFRADAKAAMHKGDFEAVKEYYEKGVYDNEFSEKNIWQNRTMAFSSAARNGHKNIIEYFFDKGGNPNMLSGYLLTDAAKFSTTEMVELIVEKGASISSISKAMANAAWYGKTENVETLLSKGAEISYGEQEALMMAACSGKTETVKFLVESGADLNTKDDRTLQLAITNNHAELTKAIIIDLKMTIKPETQKWLEDNNHSYALQLITKRDLFNKLNQTLESKPSLPKKMKQLGMKL